MPKDEYDDSDPSSIYNNSFSFDDAINSVMNALNDTINENTLSNPELTNDIIKAIEGIEKYFNSVDGNDVDNEYNIAKRKKLIKLRDKYNNIYHKLESSVKTDNVDKSMSVKPILSIDYTNIDEIQTENELSVIESIKEIIGDSKLTLEKDGDNFMPNIDLNSISSGDTNYVDAINKLANKIELNDKLILSNTDKLKCVANSLHSIIINRNPSSNPLITKAFNNMYIKIYNIAFKENIRLKPPINLNHISINENDNNFDESNTKLTINQYESDEIMDNMFKFLSPGGKYSNGNLKLIVNTLENEIDDAESDIDKRDSILKSTNNLMSSVKTKMKQLSSEIKNIDNKDINKKK